MSWNWAAPGKLFGIIIDSLLSDFTPRIIIFRSPDMDSVGPGNCVSDLTSSYGSNFRCSLPLF